jgi:phospholipid/cholesterol/gamma-HCH transport system substrate-binding protein
MPHARGVSLARLRVIVVVLPALVILGAIVYLLTGGTLLQEKVTLYLYIPDATGVGSGSAVRVNGTAVGKVAAVALSGSAQRRRIIRVTLSVERNHLRDIPSNSTAQISAETAVGDKYVDITQGNSTVPIRSGGEILYRREPEVVKTLDLQQFTRRLREIDATLADIQQGKTPVGELIVGDQMYKGLRKDLVDADRTFREATNAGTPVGQLLYTDHAYRRISDPLARLDDRLERIEAGQGDYGHLLREDGPYVHLERQAASLRQSLAEIRAQRFFASDDQYISWNRELGLLIRRVGDINTSDLFSNSLEYDNLAGYAGHLRDSLRDFRENPRKFLRIQLF